MRINQLLWLYLATALAISGCADGPSTPSAMLTYETEPAGAVIYEGGQPLGTAPVTRTYHSDGKSDTIQTPDVTAVWPSGAKTTYFTLLPIRSDRVATIRRPATREGLERDQENAKKYAASQEQIAQRQKEEAARELARSSARCKAQQANGGPKAGFDDCS